MKKMILTGATSMIGSAIIRRSLAHSVDKIYAVVRPNSKNMDHVPKDSRIEIVECSVDRLFELPEKIRDTADVFYHIAWGLTGKKRNQDLTAQAENITYTIDAVKAAKALGCKKFIGAGSQAEYGNTHLSIIHPDTPVNPVQPYGIAKYAAGKLGKAEADLLGIPFIWVRIFSVYGPYEKKTTMISTALAQMLRGESPAFTDATQTWDFLYADDAGEAFYRLGELVDQSEVYCLGSGDGKMLRDYILQMRDAVAPGLPVRFGEIPYGPGGSLNICADIRSLTKDTGWKPQTSFPEGIRKTLSF